MAVKIGHASISERGTINGAKGDSTGREVCTRTWYSKNWNYVLIPVNDTIAEKSAKACEAGCANENIGYGQSDRNSAHNEAKKVNYDLSKIKTKCNTDCSAFMTLCALSAGVKTLEYTINAPTTSTMVNAFVKSGFYKKSNDSKYLKSDEYLKRGYILVCEGHHTVMVLSNGSKAGKTTSTSTTSTPVKTTTTSIKYYPKYAGDSKSFVDALASVGEKDTSANHRAKIASANGIKDYSDKGGSSEQNGKLMTLLKAGTLIRA